MPIINHLAENPASSLKDVAGSLGLAKPTVSVSLRRLERQGLVSRRPHPQDQRAVQLSLTAAGQRLYEEVLRFRRRLAAEMLAGLDAAEQEEFLRLLAKALDAAANSNTANEPPTGRIA